MSDEPKSEAELAAEAAAKAPAEAEAAKSAAPAGPTELEASLQASLEEAKAKIARLEAAAKKPAAVAAPAIKAGQALVTVKFGTVHHAEPVARAKPGEHQETPVTKGYGPGDTFAVPKETVGEFAGHVAAGAVEIAA